MPTGGCGCPVLPCLGGAFFYDKYIKQGEIQMNFEPLLKAVTVLVQLVTIYLLITWTYQGLDFVARSIFQ